MRQGCTEAATCSWQAKVPMPHELPQECTKEVPYHTRLYTDECQCTGQSLHAVILSQSCRHHCQPGSLKGSSTDNKTLFESELNM